MGCKPEGFELKYEPQSLETDLVTWRLHEDPGVIWGPRGRGGARRFSLDPEIVFGTRRPLRPYRNPEVSSLDPEIFDWNLEAIGEPGGTVLPLPRQGYYRYLFGFRILPLGSRPLSSSYAVFYFCRKSLTGFRGCWCGCYDPSTRLRCFLGTFHIGTLGAPMRLRLHRGFRKFQTVYPSVGRSFTPDGERTMLKPLPELALWFSFSDERKKKIFEKESTIIIIEKMRSLLSRRSRYASLTFSLSLKHEICSNLGK
ncbi:hypothetical protein F2Q69_00021697 [Brassica cretica]|uniref:Uncharacterized protein n=1 Tax=Brassica cretica TaxID=69181 RepID=A0A8S9QEN6_BRACR|nr:hypothetical protein F2Q69_00021697 [Brassica cretica]